MALFRGKRDKNLKPVHSTEPLRAVAAGKESSTLPRPAAGMTVEAALALPLFLFFLTEILGVFEMIRLQSRLLQALHETGTQMAEYAFYAEYATESALSALQETIGTSPGEDLQEQWDKLLEEETGLVLSGLSLALSETYVRSSVEDYMGEAYLDKSCLDGGADGISYLQSEVMTEDGIIDLVADYSVSPALSFFGLNGFSLQSRYYGHAWTGYELGGEESSEEEGEEDITVYITPTGSVYHLDSDCTYLKPSIISVDASGIDDLRSSDGSKYYACEVCESDKTGTLYITTDGNRYHSSSSCSALKRTVLETTLSQVEGTRDACSRCGASS